MQSRRPLRSRAKTTSLAGPMRPRPARRPTSPVGRSCRPRALVRRHRSTSRLRQPGAFAARAPWMASSGSRDRRPASPRKGPGVLSRAFPLKGAETRGVCSVDNPRDRHHGLGGADVAWSPGHRLHQEQAMTKDKVRGIAMLQHTVKDVLCVATVAMSALCFVAFVVII